MRSHLYATSACGRQVFFSLARSLENHQHPFNSIIWTQTMPFIRMSTVFLRLSRMPFIVMQSNLWILMWQLRQRDYVSHRISILTQNSPKEFVSSWMKCALHFISSNFIVYAIPFRRLLYQFHIAFSHYQTHSPHPPTYTCTRKNNRNRCFQQQTIFIKRFIWSGCICCRSTDERPTVWDG